MSKFKTFSNTMYDSSERIHPLVEEITALLHYRELIYQFVSRSIKTRYKRSMLGVIWTMLNPLLTMIVLTVVFSQLFKISIANFPVYVLSGQLVWIFFSTTTGSAMGEMLWSGELLKRIYVPKSVYAMAAVGTGLVNFVGTGLVNLIISLVPLSLIALLLGLKMNFALLTWPLAILLLSGFTLGLSLLLSTTTVYFADMLPVYNVILTIWLYATPIIYPLDIVPLPWQRLFAVAKVVFIQPTLLLCRAFPPPIAFWRCPWGRYLASGSSIHGGYVLFRRMGLYLESKRVCLSIVTHR
jgi:ABC-type polysaccharide/polyol phosphate export permease